MDILKQPHDKYFKAIFGKLDFTKEFLADYLPVELLNIMDMSTIEAQKDTYLDKDLREQFSDLLFRVQINNKDSYIYLLFEHKSYRDKRVIFQVLRYMLEIWESKIELEVAKPSQEGEMRADGNVEIPIILPLVIYHDKSRWTVKRTLGELIPNYEALPKGLKKYMPNFEYLLVDLSQWPEETVKSSSNYMIWLKVLSQTRHATSSQIRELFFEIMQLAHRLKEKDSVTYYLSETIRYILSIREDINEVEMKIIAERISTEGGGLVMSVAERLMQEGVEKGIEKERIRMAKNLMKINLPLDQIVTTTGLTKEELHKISMEED